MNTNKAQNGFSLIELMITLAILAILIMVAAPSMESSRKKSAVTGLQREFISSLALARGEASVKGRPVSICPSADTQTCDTNTDWSKGWLVFLETGQGDGAYSSAAGDTLIRAYKNEGASKMKVVDPLDSNQKALNSLTWNARGFSKDAQRALVVVCDRSSDVKFARGLMIASSGRAIKTRDSDGDGIHDMSFIEDNGSKVTAVLTCP
ncbi:GspH/FimT family pseudopilin [Agaribacterium haliotis]|uniref:GspH/FimT family pseudopilin n=1 Tax=Agaribacterium haliotis TaxID=2013869 RepID=UPI000BB5411C|nr:GspH/FimT family pseudopilin [Agaribacterium haliotis]